MKKKFYVTLLTLTTLISTLAVSGTSVYANSQDTKEYTTSSDITYNAISELPITDNDYVANNDYGIQPRLLGSVAVFVGGVLVGYIVDGVVIYATGVSISQHMANGMMAAQRWYYAHRFGPNYSSIHVVNGAVFGGGSGSF